MSNNRDRLFQYRDSKPFEFDKSVATVFDDMISRSVPFYHQALDLSVEFALGFLQDGDRVVDLGCSTATTLIELHNKSLVELELIGIDNSQSMIQQATKKITAYNMDIKLILEDIMNYDINNSKVVISNYTLQFIEPKYRIKLLKNIFKGLKNNGVFIFSEKLKSKDTLLDSMMTKIYFETHVES
jgi:tRNA (cmo5U34)-methyltransferase